MVKNDLKKYVNKVVKIKTSENWSDGKKETEYLALVLEPKMRAEISYPYDLKLKCVECGARSFEPSDIISISPVTKEEFVLWRKEYQNFHNDMVADKGFDPCEVENLNKVTYLAEV